jgi:surfactin synthase thioesterase subunit
VRPVQYPGRENRIRESAADSIETLADGIADAILNDDPSCCVLFGHSMGGTVALEVAHRLVVAGVDLRHVIVSAALPPHADGMPGVRSTLLGPELIAELKQLGGIDEELFDFPELAEVVVSTFRSDLAALERYRLSSRPPLTCPITAFTGADDTGVTQDQVAHWSELTSAGFDLCSFPGGHFYLWEASAEIVGRAEALLLRDAPPEAPHPQESRET